MKKNYKYIYGPVSSWRLGRSLGIDLLSQTKKICNFDCIYCQLGRTTDFISQRKIYVPSEEIINEIKSLDDDVTIDYYTFSGRGEPTLAENLGEVVDGLKKINKGPLAILTNSSLIARYDVREALRKIDFVSLKLDAYSQESFEKIDRPAEGIEFSSIVKGMREFANSYRGRLALQMMFVDENKNHAKELADIAKSINPDEVQLNTPLRPSGIKPISEQELDKIERQFKGLDMDIISVYHAEHKKVKSISAKDTLKRRGKTE